MNRIWPNKPPYIELSNRYKDLGDYIEKECTALLSAYHLGVPRDRLRFLVHQFIDEVLKEGGGLNYWRFDVKKLGGLSLRQMKDKAFYSLAGLEFNEGEAFDIIIGGMELLADVRRCRITNCQLKNIVIATMMKLPTD